MTSSILQDHSQTFIGVLASLLLITIIWSHESNFVLGIIEERSKALKEVWKDLNDSFRKRSKKWNFLKSSTEKKFQNMMEFYVEGTNSSNKKIHMTEDDQNRLCLLDERMETAKEIFVTDYFREIMPMIDNKIDSIKNSKKIVVSAIFALMSCLLIFIIDESMAIFPGMRDFAVSFLCLFLLIASAFWLGMWGSFFVRHLPVDWKWKFHRRKEGFIKTGSSFKLTGSLTVVALVSCCIAWLCSRTDCFLNNMWIGRAVVFGVGMILPVIIVGIKKMNCRDYRQGSPYSFAINHFLDFCMLALIWCAIIFIGSIYLPSLSRLLFIYEDWNAMLVFLELYVLFIGIICPIFIPYLNTYVLQWYMKSRQIEPKRLIKKDDRWKSINKDIVSLYNSVTK